MKAVGVYLQEHRKAAGLTQEDVARRLGVVSRTVSDWETGRYSPGFDFMVRMLRLIGGQIEDTARLFLGEQQQEQDEALTEQKLLAMADTDPKRRALLRRMAELSDDPDLTARIEAYLDGLEAGRSSRPNP